MNTTTRPLARLLPLASFTLVGALAPNLAQAAQLDVCGSGCSYPSIQAAVDAAHDGDVIIVEEDRGESVSIDRALQIHIRPPWGERAVVNANLADYAFHIGAEADVKLTNLDISGATLAGVFSEGTGRLVNTTVHGNSAVYGGVLNTGLLVLNGTTSIYSNASTSYYAGGLNNFGGTVHTWGVDVSFIGNYGYNGGGVANIEGNMHLRGVTISGNSSYLGGGVHNSFGDLWISDSLIQMNGASSIGGGWSNHNLGGTVNTSNVVYYGNVTDTNQYVDCYDVNGPC